MAAGPVLKAGRDDARAAIRGGRLEAALAIYQGLDAGSFEAEDFSALGTALLEGDHLVLGWTALEAARRIDPRHGPIEPGPGRTPREAGRRVGPDALRETTEEVETLRGVRGGPPLGMLVLGLARFAGDRDHERDFLERLQVRDRAAMRAVTTTADALKLVARLLLETGRPAEASDLLRPILARAGDAPAGPPAKGDATRPDRAGSTKDATADDASPPGPATDREAAWLLSRAALQLDQDQTADAMLAMASGFGTGDRPSPEPAPYIGARRCGACHPGSSRRSKTTTAHARTLYLGAGLKDVPLPAKPVPDPVAPGLTHRFSRPADDRIELESRTRTRPSGP